MHKILEQSRTHINSTYHYQTVVKFNYFHFLTPLKDQATPKHWVYVRLHLLSTLLIYLSNIFGRLISPLKMLGLMSLRMKNIHFLVTI